MNDRSVLRIGGICAVALGLGCVVTIPLFASVGAPPSTAQALLTYVARKTTVWWTILALSVLTDLLYIPVGLALFTVLRAANLYVTLLATALIGLFVTLDLGVTWTSYASLIMLSGDYASATSDSQRAALVAAATFPATILASKLEDVYAIVILSVAILVMGALMLRVTFSRVAAYVGIATGIAGITTLSGWSVTVVVNALLATVWVLIVGYVLVRQRRLEPGDAG